MKKITCEIIKDLIPSYIDNICSDDSRQAVEEHLSDCEICRKYYRDITETEFTDDGLELKQINYLKKIKKSYFIAILPVLFFLFAILTRNNNPIISHKVIYVISALLILLSVFTRCRFGNQEKQSALIWALSVIPLLYMAIWYLALENVVRTGIPLFGRIELTQIGPVMDFQLIVALIVEIILFCYQWVNGIITEKSSTINLIFTISVASTLLVWDYMLFTLVSIDTLMHLIIKAAGIHFLLFAVGGISFYTIKHFKNRRGV